MKAIQIEKERQMAVVDIPVQEMKSNEVLLRLEYVGFCGSDLSTYLGKNPMVRMPVIPGHEVGAVIEKVGADVPEGLKPGMIVTVNPYTNCGKCPTVIEDTDCNQSKSEWFRTIRLLLLLLSHFSCVRLCATP